MVAGMVVVWCVVDGRKGEEDGATKVQSVGAWIVLIRSCGDGESEVERLHGAVTTCAVERGQRLMSRACLKDSMPLSGYSSYFHNA